MKNLKKLLGKFFNKPDSLKYIEIEKILLKLGFQKIEAKGSHKKFKHILLKQDIIIPVHNNDCKAFYKNYISKILKLTIFHQHSL